jgi:hypothetical protein
VDRVRSRGIDRTQRTVAHLRADECGVDLAGHGDVVSEAAAAGEERPVLAAQGIAVAAESQHAIAQRRPSGAAH